MPLYVWLALAASGIVVVATTLRDELQGSLATAAVLTSAFGETRALIGRVSGFMPRK